MTERVFEHNGVTARLILGDCRDVLPIAADAVVTDPPYGIGFAAQPTTGGRKRGQEAERWDDEPIADLHALLAYAPILAIWGGNYYPLPLSRGWLTWYKPDAPPSMASVEFAWTNLDQNARQISHSIAATNPERIGHPTQKPVRVIVWTMERIDVPIGATVVDPFLGSGTTGIACLRTRRNFIGIEIDPTHYATACARLERECRQPMLAL